jgi:hypothetical protein
LKATHPLCQQGTAEKQFASDTDEWSGVASWQPRAASCLPIGASRAAAVRPDPQAGDKKMWATFILHVTDNLFLGYCLVVSTGLDYLDGLFAGHLYHRIHRLTYNQHLDNMLIPARGTDAQARNVVYNVTHTMAIERTTRQTPAKRLLRRLKTARALPFTPLMPLSAARRKSGSLMRSGWSGSCKNRKDEDQL